MCVFIACVYTNMYVCTCARDSVICVCVYVDVIYMCVQTDGGIFKVMNTGQVLWLLLRMEYRASLSSGRGPLVSSDELVISLDKWYALRTRPM